MKRYHLPILPVLLLLPYPALAASTGSLDYWTLSVFVTANFIITASLFGLGIVIAGLYHNRLKPWMKELRTQRRERKRRYSRPPAC